MDPAKPRCCFLPRNPVCPAPPEPHLPRNVARARGGRRRGGGTAQGGEGKGKGASAFGGMVAGGDDCAGVFTPNHHANSRTPNPDLGPQTPYPEPRNPNSCKPSP